MTSIPPFILITHSTLEVAGTVPQIFDFCGSEDARKCIDQGIPQEVSSVTYLWKETFCLILATFTEAVPCHRWFIFRSMRGANWRVFLCPAPTDAKTSFALELGLWSLV